MGCLSGCFGGAKDRKRRKQRINRSSPQRQQRNRDQHVLQQENKAIAEQSTEETITTPLVPELRTEPEVVEQQLSPTPSTKLVPELRTKFELVEQQPSPTASTKLVHVLRTEIELVEQQPSPRPNLSRTPSTKLVPKLRTEPELVEQQPSPIPSPILSQTPSPKRRVTFNSNITAYEHILVIGSTDSLPECTTNSKNENQEDSKTSNRSRSISEEDNSITSSVASYPSNHRYHNAARGSDDETEEYGDSDLDDLDEDDDEDNDYGYEDEDEDIDDAMILGKEIWSESVLTPSVESRTGHPSRQDLNDEVESPMMLGSKANARDRSDYINSVLNPVENISQWKAVKSKGTKAVSKPQKENLTAAAANFESPRASFSLEPTFKKKTDELKNTNQGIAVDTSLSNWLGSPEIVSSKKTSFSGSEGRTSVRSYDDRPILGALTVEELRQFSASNSPRKSPSRSPDEMPIIGSVGTYWNHSSSKKHTDSSSSFKGIPNTTSKYREDKRVNWHSTPFEKRLDRALNRGAAEA